MLLLDLKKYPFINWMISFYFTRLIVGKIVGVYITLPSWGVSIISSLQYKETTEWLIVLTDLWFLILFFYLLNKRNQPS
jgi:hypothetical protein